MTDRNLPRRAVLLGGLGIALAGCAANTKPPAGTPPPTTTPTDQDLAALEAGFGGRLGVYAVDTGRGTTVQYRADERFLMCSTYKALVVSAIIRLRDHQPDLLGRVIHYDRSQVLSHSPITSQHVNNGMTVSALCQAAISVSDNTAANLLVAVLGGPQAVTAFVRTLGDQTTRVDRTEPTLNDANGVLDTTTPAHMAADLRALALDDALDPAGRNLLTSWLEGCTTGGKLIRAGLPTSWRVGDKTGSGTHNETNDIAVAWPPGRAPLVIAVYTAPTDPASTAGAATVAGVAAIVAKALAH